MERGEVMNNIFNLKNKGNNSLSQPYAKRRRSKNISSAEEVKDVSAQEWIPVKDISGNILYRKDSHIVAGLSIEPINFELLSKREKRAIIISLKDIINGINEHFQWLSIGRPVDLDSYIKGLEDKKQASDNTIKKRLLQSYAKQAADIASSGEVQERKFFMFFELKMDKYAVDDITNLVKDINNSISTTQLKTSILTERDHIAVNYLLAHPVQAAYERPPVSARVQLPMAVDIDEIYLEDIKDYGEENN